MHARRLFLASCGMAVLLLPGCETTAGHPTADLSSHASAEFIDATFEELYPTFLYRRSMSQGDKANQWTKYRDRWVRWEGVITSITNKGVTFKHLKATVTFDVSLTCDAASLKAVKGRFAVGDRVRYVGRLTSFDDIFRTMYLSNGAVIEKRDPADLGVIADMAHPANP